MNCCAGYNYQLSYVGLENPPHIQAIGYDFGFSPGFGYVTMRNFAPMFNFLFYSYPGDFTLYHQPWGDKHIVSNVTLYDRDGNWISVTLNYVQPKSRFYITLKEIGYYDIVVITTSGEVQNNEHRLNGYKLAERSDIDEAAGKFLKLYVGRLDGLINSDFDLILDQEEQDLGTDPHLADTDGDGLELRVGSDPMDDGSILFDITSEIHINYRILLYKVFLETRETLCLVSSWHTPLFSIPSLKSSISMNLQDRFQAGPNQ